MLGTIVLGIALAMDAFAISLTEGLVIKKLKWQHVFYPAITFGLFQALMPYLGYELGSIFINALNSYGHYISSGLLFIVGLKMIFDGYLEKQEEEEKETKSRGTSLLFLGVATSIDALVIGFSLSLSEVKSLIQTVVGIGIITFFISVLGVIIGHRASKFTLFKGEYLGGVILIILSFINFIKNIL